MTMQRVLRKTKGTALLFFLDDEIEFFEDSAEVLCSSISQQYKCKTWHNYVWDTIFVDIDQCSYQEVSFSVVQEYKPIEYPDRAELNTIIADITQQIEDKLPAKVITAGYYVYTYTEFVV
jgi:hypothetical protein